MMPKLARRTKFGKPLMARSSAHAKRQRRRATLPEPSHIMLYMVRNVNIDVESLEKSSRAKTIGIAETHVEIRNGILKFVYGFCRNSICIMKRVLIVRAPCGS